MSAVEKLYVLGHPVGHSKSPVMYNAVYARLGLPWHYDFMDVPDEGDARAFLAAQDFLSINITTPYKPHAFEAAAVRMLSADLTQGANILVKTEGGLTAHNTDGQGCVSYLRREGVVFEGAHVVVCGTGPTARAILHAAAKPPLPAPMTTASYFGILIPPSECVMVIPDRFPTTPV